MKLTTKKLTALVLVLGMLLAVLLTGCSSKKSSAIVVGSKNFTENLILAEIYALALEDNGFTVERKLNLNGSTVHTSIVNDEIDLYPEYTGTGLLSVLQLPMETDPQKVYDTVKAAYADQFDITWLDYSPANDGQGLVITRRAADAYHISTISDLQAKSENIRFASQGEFDEREDGIPGLTKAYGPFSFQSSKTYDNALKYQILKNNEADVAPAYTTEGQLTDTENFLLLTDDKQFWPPYNVAPIVRNDTLTENEGLADVLNKLAPFITTETITALNAKVDLDQQEYEEVAAEYYASIAARLK